MRMQALRFELGCIYLVSFIFLTSLLVGPTRNFSFSLSSNLFLILQCLFHSFFSLLPIYSDDENNGFFVFRGPFKL